MKTRWIILFALALGIVFAAAAQDDDESSDVNVGIGEVCTVGAKGFKAPGVGAEDYRFQPLNTTGYVVGKIANYGNLGAKVRANLTVTKEDDHWEPGEKVGNLTNLSKQNYTKKFYEIDLFNLSYQNTGDEGAANETFVNYGRNTSGEGKPFMAFPAFTDNRYNYGTGNFTARLRFNYTCPSSENSSGGNFWVNRTFRVIRAEAGEGGGSQQGDPLTNNTAPENVTDPGETSNESIPRDANRTGEESNQNITRNATRPGGQSNVTRPEDVSQQGEESDQALEGNEPEPGQTPVPQPQPVPNPAVRLDLRALNNTYNASWGSYARITMEIENLGDETIQNLDIVPQLSEKPGWDFRNASIANISSNETVKRDVFVKPTSQVDPGLYQIATVIRGQNGDMLDLDYFDVKVTGRRSVSGLSIAESPVQVEVGRNSTENIPILLSNSGTTDLENITARLQNIEGCGSVQSPEITRLNANETGAITLELKASSQLSNCDASLVISSSDGAYAFSDLNIQVQEKQGIIPERFRFPIIGSLWTALLVAYALLTRKYGLNSATVKIPFIILIVGEVAIAVYLTGQYYGILPEGLLPF